MHRINKNVMFIILSFLIILIMSGCSMEKTQHNDTTFDNLPGNLGQVAENDENYFVITTQSNVFVINKQTGKVSPACSNAACSHKDGVCVYNHGVECIKNYEGKILLICKDGDNLSNYLPAIYELNPDTYELTVFKKLDNPVYYFEFYENYLIYSYADYEKEDFGWNVKDLSTGEERQLLDRNSLRHYFGIKDRFIYLTTTEYELYRINLDNGEKEVIVKNCMDVVLYKDKLYYNRFNSQHGKFGLCSASIDGTSEKMLIGKITAFQIYDDQIFYLDDEKTLLKADLNGRILQQIIDGVEDMNFLILPTVKQIIASSKDDFTKYFSVNFDGSDRKEIFSYHK